MPSHGLPHMAALPGQRPSPAIMAAPGLVAPAGTFAPGTKIQVGSHRVVIQKYLSEGGFAHVYVVRLPKPVDGTDVAVLKRVAVPDKDALRSMRTEVETMKRLKGHRPIVTYIDSHASEMRGGGYEVFLLMEYCSGGGLIDFMNTRLQHRLTEPEIVAIFADIAEGVACMHYLKPPLLHRDIKVENVLIASDGSARRFKLCDFGSASPARPAPSTVVECRLMDDDVQKHTTLQYRSPEMIDVYRKQPLNEKSDIWALGVLLYKLCYYTTPFEDQGQLAILNASYRFPSHPTFSDRIKKLIASMLRENMDERPTIYQALKEACAMQGRAVPVQDIYAATSPAKGRPSERPPPPPDQKARLPQVGATYSPPVQEQAAIPSVVPMRRGRPTPSPGPTNAHRPDAPPPTRVVTEGDPFAALDSKSPLQFEADELSSKFPTLDQFSLLHDHGGKFDFDCSAATSPFPHASAHDANYRLTEKLADAAFASSRNSPANANPPTGPPSATPTTPYSAIASPPADRPPSARPQAEVSRAQTIISSNPDLKAISSQSASRYVSTGTMTNDASPQGPLRPADAGPRQTRPEGGNSSSSMPYRPAHLGQLDDGGAQAAKAELTARPKTFASRPRPASTNFESSTLEFLREREASKAQSKLYRATSRDSFHRASPSLQGVPARPGGDYQAPKASALVIDTDGSDSEGSQIEVRSKRYSVPSGPGPKILAGKFGDAFQRFESNAPAGGDASARAPSPLGDLGRRDVTPIAGSEAVDERIDSGLIELSDDDGDDDDVTPEARREIERRQLEEEERRVAAAQAEYKSRVAGGDAASRPVPAPKKSSIQSRVQNLLDEDQRATHIQRTAEGYGKYSDAATAASKTDKPLPLVPRKPPAVSKPRGETTATTTTMTTTHEAGTAPQSRGHATTGASVTGLPTSKAAAAGKPAAPKKPVHLNSFPTGGRPPSPAKNSQPTQLEGLLAADLAGQAVLEATGQERDDYMEDFAKRFPSLSSMEMEAGRGGAVGR